MKDQIIKALDFFGFLAVEHYKGNTIDDLNFQEESFTQRFECEELSYGEPFSWAFKTIPITIDIQVPAPPYHISTLTIIDPITRNRIFFKELSLRPLIIELIDNRLLYYRIFFSQQIMRIVNNYSIIQSKFLDLDKDVVELYVVCKQFESSMWGGLDKDNIFTIYIQHTYFLVFDGYILIDDYLREVIQKPWTKKLKTYHDYKPTSDIDTDNYWIKKADEHLLDFFKINYSGYNHKMYVDSITKLS